MVLDKHGRDQGLWGHLLTCESAVSRSHPLEVEPEWTRWPCWCPRLSQGLLLGLGTFEAFHPGAEPAQQIPPSEYFGPLKNTTVLGALNLWNLWPVRSPQRNKNRNKWLSGGRNMAVAFRVWTKSTKSTLGKVKHQASVYSYFVSVLSTGDSNSFPLSSGCRHWRMIEMSTRRPNPAITRTGPVGFMSISQCCPKLFGL